MHDSLAVVSRSTSTGEVVNNYIFFQFTKSQLCVWLIEETLENVVSLILKKQRRILRMSNLSYRMKLHFYLATDLMNA